MKHRLFFCIFCCLLASVLPGSLFADTGVGGRIDAGLDIVTIPATVVPFNTKMGNGWVGAALPVIDANFSTQFSLGPFHTGLGIRGVSLIYLNVLWPSFYAEMDIWRFTLTAQLGGGAVYVFPIWFFAGPYLVPELSLWFRFMVDNTQFRVGLGAMTLVSPLHISEAHFQDFHNKGLFYLACKITVEYPWWPKKREAK